MSDPVATGWEDETDYRVDATGNNAEGKPYSMDPVCFLIRSGSVCLQDYLTPDAARALGQALILTAHEVERQELRATETVLT